MTPLASTLIDAPSGDRRMIAVKRGVRRFTGLRKICVERALPCLGKPRGLSFSFGFQAGAA